MREEDEIRAAVIALAEAQAAGEDISDELPHGEVAAEAAEASPFGDDTSEEEQRDAAIALVLDAVRAATREGRLAQPSEWEPAGLVPTSMTAEDVEMAVYDALMEHGDPMPEGASATGEGSAQAARPVNRHVHSAFSSSNGRCVGTSPFKHKAASAKEEQMTEMEPLADSSAVEEPRGDVGRSDRASSAATGTAQWAVPPSEDCPSESECPAAPTEMSREGESECPGAPTGATEADEAAPLPYDCTNIRLLMGKASYYLYDASAMTDAYGRWAFLAAEDDPVTAFVECVREESSVYPRPMARTNLANDPFRMDAEAVEAAFAEARAQGRADDIERTEASNGDVYFYSTAYLSPARAKALAEWDAVERKRNV
ncbi:hypothetical protein [Adlercreutzia caecimuris]|uniref:Uncharacterized protein n=1 Tax=Adlercreutzia caecimuris B7 TaxID=1235794 RepID=R9KU65_9ACTN|nr:hypothetical protein [Adlercreutzia caecimuris]EOS49910.1 hypothetical protein C811_02375 [Adlercreutzia caecimuris B7]